MSVSSIGRMLARGVVAMPLLIAATDAMGQAPVEVPISKPKAMKRPEVSTGLIPIALSVDGLSDNPGGNGLKDAQAYALADSFAERLTAANPSPKERTAYWAFSTENQTFGSKPAIIGWNGVISEYHKDGDSWVVKMEVHPRFNHGAVYVCLIADAYYETYRISPKTVEFLSAKPIEERKPMVMTFN
jgi:hypothetical protein